MEPVLTGTQNNTNREALEQSGSVSEWESGCKGPMPHESSCLELTVNSDENNQLIRRDTHHASYYASWIGWLCH